MTSMMEDAAVIVDGEGLDLVAVEDTPASEVVEFEAPPPADQNPYLVYLGRLTSPESRRTMAGCLDRLARLAVDAPLDAATVTGRDFPWGRLRYQHTARLRALVADQGWSPAHANKHLISLRQVIREAWRLGHLTADERDRACDLEQVKGERVPAGRMLALGEIAALLDACSAAGTAKGRRDAALIAVAYASGARRSEVVAADLSDWDPIDGLVLHGKGHKDRRVALAGWAVRYLDAWLRVRGEAPGPLFTRVVFTGKANPVGRVTLNRLSTQSVADVLKDRTDEVDARRFTAHDLRRTLISTMLDDPDTDLVTVQTIAGHASPDTTARYDRRGVRAAQAAAARLPDPHAGRVAAPVEDGSVGD